MTGNTDKLVKSVGNYTVQNVNKNNIMKRRKIEIDFFIETEINHEILEKQIKSVLEKYIPRAERIEVRTY